EALQLLGQVYSEMKTIDSSAEYNIRPHGFLKNLLGIMVQHFRVERLARAYQVIFDYLNSSIDLDDSVRILKDLKEYKRYSTVLDPTTKDFMYILSKYDCFKLKS